jgi:hypothetical protein
MGKAIAGCLEVMASIAAIPGLLVALNILRPFPSPTLPALTVSPASIKAETDWSVGPPQFTFPGKSAYACNAALTASGQGRLQWAGNREPHSPPNRGYWSQGSPSP